MVTKRKTEPTTAFILNETMFLKGLTNTLLTTHHKKKSSNYLQLVGENVLLGVVVVEVVQGCLSIKIKKHIHEMLVGRY